LVPYPRRCRRRSPAAQSRRDIDAVELRGRPLPTRDLLWTFRDDLVKTPRSYACRRGPWKYLEIGGEAMLFHLDHDPGESHNLAARHPRLLEQLRNRAYTLRQPGD
jgi:hypothetical protein